MEKLEDPRKLAYNLQIAANSDLESFLQLSEPSPPSSHRQQTAAAAPARTSDERFQSALQIFTQQGDTSSFQKNIEDTIEASMTYVPHLRAFVKALESTVDEFLEAEDKGGLPKEDIKQLVQHLHTALHSIIDVQADRKVLQELLGLLRELPASNVGPIEVAEGGHGTRRDLDSDEEEGMEEEENPEDDENDEAEAENEAANETARVISQYKNAQFLEDKRKGFLVGLRKEQEGNALTLKRVLDKILDKRGYKWSLTEDGVIKESKRPSTVLASQVVQRILDDPITKSPISTDPVRSRVCKGPHIYERASILQLIAQRGGNPTKCAYLGCGVVIHERDLIEDADYARFLARNTAAGGPADNQAEPDEVERTQQMDDDEEEED